MQETTIHACEKRQMHFIIALCASVFVLAFLARAWTNTWLTDFWGDSYHHWLITRLTLLHGGVYSDYKGLETVWSPLYHYVSMIPFLLSGSSDIRVLQWMNTLFGAFACALCAYLAWKLFANRVAALLATMTWHVAFSGMNVTEVFSGVLVVAVVLVVVRDESSKRGIYVCEISQSALAVRAARAVGGGDGRGSE